MIFIFGSTWLMIFIFDSTMTFIFGSTEGTTAIPAVLHAGHVIV